MPGAAVLEGSKANSAPDAKGDEGPHFSWRAIAAGTCIGALMCAANMYFGLQTGWVTMGSLQSALLGFGLFKALGQWTGAAALGTHELVLLQATSVAAATMPLAGGFVGILPALAVMSPEEGGPVTFPIWKQLLWCLALAPLGVFVAVPLREVFIVRAKLRFPSGTATAEMIRVLQAGEGGSVKGGEEEEDDSGLALVPAPAPADLEVGEEVALLAGPGRPQPADPAAPRATMASKWRLLLATMALSATVALLSRFIPVLGALPVFSWLGAPEATAYGWTLSPSLGYVGQGLIMGPHTTLSMLLGATLGWGVLGPVAAHNSWAPGPVMDSTSGPRGWITWVSLALMLGDTLTALTVLLLDMVAPSCRKGVCPWAVPDRRPTAQTGAYAPVATSTPTPTPTPTPWTAGSMVSALASTPSTMVRECRDMSWCSFGPDDTVPSAVWVPGLLASGALTVAVVAPVMNVSAWEVLAAVFLAVLVAPLAIRTLGVSDLNPTSGLGKLSQGVFAAVAPGNVLSNLMAGAVAEAAAQQAGDISQDNKTGHLLGSSPLALFYAQMWGSLVSVVFTVAAYALYTSAYTVPGPELSAPTSAIWLDMASLISGKAALPAHVEAAAGAAGGVAVALAAVTASLPPSLAWTMPAVTAAGVGMYLTPNWTLPRVVGGLAQAVWKAYAPAHHDDYMIVAASGFVLGEGLMSIVTAGITAAGGGDAWTCAGCAVGACGGGCP